MQRSLRIKNKNKGSNDKIFLRARSLVRTGHQTPNLKVGGSNPPGSVYTNFNESYTILNLKTSVLSIFFF